MSSEKDSGLCQRVECAEDNISPMQLIHERLKLIRSIYQLFLEPEWALSQEPMRPKVEWLLT